MLIMPADIDAAFQKNRGRPQRAPLRMSHAHGIWARMGRLNHHSARKRSTNVSLNEDLVSEAKQLGLSISAACEQGLAAQVKSERERRWLEENAEAIAKFNEFVDKNGNPLAHLRMF